MWKKGRFLEKEFIFKDFNKAMTFVNKIAKIANKIDHHPEILIHSWNKVLIKTRTHSENKVTQKDYQLVKEIDKL